MEPNWTTPRVRPNSTELALTALRGEATVTYEAGEEGLWVQNDAGAWIAVAQPAGAATPPVGASTTQAGVSELATPGELAAGTAGVLVATVADLKAYLDGRLAPPNNTYDGATALTAFPVGTSIMHATTASTGWPTAGVAYNVVTYHAVSNEGAQIVTRASAAGETYVRRWDSFTVAWGSWVRLDPVAATTSLAGVIEIATTAEHQAGTDATRAATPAGIEAWRPTNAYCELTRAADQTISDATFEDIAWNSETRDPLGWHASSPNAERITPNLSRMWDVSVYSIWTSNTSGIRRVRLKKNNVLVAQESIPPPAGNASAPQCTTFKIFCNGTTDYISADVWQNSGGPLALSMNSTIIVG